jgi:hypothetical protein
VITIKQMTGKRQRKTQLKFSEVMASSHSCTEAKCGYDKEKSTKCKIVRRILCPHTGGYEEYYLLGYNAV